MKIEKRCFRKSQRKEIKTKITSFIKDSYQKIVFYYKERDIQQ